MDLDHHTGGTVAGWDHVLQSIETILITRLDTRVFRRDFGSDLAELIDAPMNDAGVLGLYVAVAEAIELWEPRFELTDISLEAAETGAVSIQLAGNHRPHAHLGDYSSVNDDARSVRLQADRVKLWRLVA